eukprot:5123433-Pleurochrysis_carterae.AAC.2
MHALPDASDVFVTLDSLQASVLACDCRSTYAECTARAHTHLPDGQICACDCCHFARDPSTREAELRAFEEKLTALQVGSRPTSARSSYRPTSPPTSGRTAVPLQDLRASHLPPRRFSSGRWTFCTSTSMRAN